MVIRCLIVPLTFAAVALHGGWAFAQDTFPAPLPGQAEAPASNSAPIASPGSAARSRKPAARQTPA